MEIPVVNRIITGGELPSLSNSIPTSLPSNLLLFPASQMPFFFKWGALAIAVVASFTTLIKAVRILIINYFNSSAAFPSSQDLFYDSDSGYDDDASLSASYSSSDSDDEDEDDIDRDSSIKSGVIFSGKWRNCSSELRRRRNGSLVDLSSLFTTGNNVVKLWENAVGTQAVSENGIVLSSLFSGNVAVSVEEKIPGRLLRLWDARVGRWDSPTRNAAVSESNKTGGVLVRDGVSGGIAAGDVRMAGSSLVQMSDADVDAWWDADSDSD